MMESCQKYWILGIIFTLVQISQQQISYTVTLGQFQYLQLELQFQNLLKSGLDCRIEVWIVTDEVESYIDERGCLTESQQYARNLSIYNYEASSQNFIIRFSISNVSEEMASVYLSDIVQSEIFGEEDMVPAALLIRDDIEDYILPYNLLSPKPPSVIVDFNEPTINRVTHSQNPFIQTYWNEYGKDSIILSWLPYFTNCQSQTSNHLFLKKILEPVYTDSSKQCKIQNYFKIFQEVACPIKNIAYTCTLQKLVSDKSNNQWFQNKKITPFYFFKYLVSKSELSSYLQSSAALTQVEENYFEMLVPLQYTVNFDLNSQTPNLFLLQFQVTLSQTLNQVYEIEKATLISDYDPLLFIQTNSETEYSPLVSLQIEVKYVSFIDNIVDYRGSTILYFIELCFILLFLLVFFRFVSIKLKLKGLEKTRLLVFPAFKGFLLTFIKFFSFLLMVYYFVSYTNFEAISTSFDNTLQTDYIAIYKGRVGFTLFTVGFFMLNSGIGQSFKMLTAQETKIILEDDMYEKSLTQKKNGQISNQSLSQLKQEKSEKQKSVFLLKNLNSHRKYLLLYIFMFAIFIMVEINYFKDRKQEQIIFIFLIALPLLHRVLILVFRHIFIKQILYLYAFLIISENFTQFLYYNSMKNLEAFVHFAQIIGFHVITNFYEVLSDMLVIRCMNYLQNCENCNQITLKYRILSKFKPYLSEVVKQSKYEKTLYYTAIISVPLISKLAWIFMFGLLNITILHTQLCKSFQISREFLLNKSFLISFWLLPAQFLFLLLNIRFCQAKLGLGISKNLEFQLFRFSSRKTNYVSDQFTLNQNIHPFYREYQKFCQSSQLFMLTYHLVFCVTIIVYSFIILIQSQYIVYEDPALLVIIIVTALVSGLWQIMFNFIFIKLKFYSRKEQYKMRAKLESIEKILKRSDYTEYLQVEAVKDYFLFHCKDWIIKNFCKIFNSCDFSANNYELLKKYKYYKNILKKRKIERKKMLQKQNGNKKDSISEEKSNNCPAPEQNKNKIQRQVRRHKQMNSYKSRQHIQMLNPDYKVSKEIIKIPEKDFEELAKPVLYSWLYIAKQFVFLKKLVAHIKEEKKKATCEMCSMNIELEAIEKTEFHEVVNEYRILNVGRSFLYQHFIDFYRFRQQYITVCLECKEKNLYYEKKKIQIKGLPTVLMKKWLLSAKSRLLHRKENVDLSKNQGISLSKQITEM